MEALTTFRRHVLHMGNVRCRRFSQRTIRVALHVETCGGFTGRGTGLRFLLGLYSDLVALNCTTNTEGAFNGVFTLTETETDKKLYV